VASFPGHHHDSDNIRTIKGNNMKKPCKRGTTFLAFVKTHRGKTKVFDFQERGTVENELG